MPTVPPFEEVVTRWVVPAHPLHETMTAERWLRRPRARVEVQITPWPNGEAEVTVRPRGRRLIAWSAARERRYFAAAHETATQIANTLSVA